MNFKLTRQSDDGIETLGILESTIPEVIFSCKTLERPWKNNQSDISCVPPGIYTCIWTWMPDMNAFHYELQNVTGRTGVFIHNGNFVANTEGCVLLGLIDAVISGTEMDIASSDKALEKFEALCGKQPITLQIIGVVS